MRIAVLGARIVLGAIFFIFGLNGFLHFLPQPAMPDAAVAFFGALAATGYMIPLLFGTQVVGGALLLARLVPLALVVLAPVIVDIVLFHVFLAPDGLPLAIVVSLLASFLAWVHRDAYRPLFVRGDAMQVVEHDGHSARGAASVR
jgi:hypothetical protein